MTEPNLRFPAVFCETLRFPAKICGFLRFPAPSKRLNFQENLRKSAVFCENLRFGLSSLSPYVRHLKLALSRSKQYLGWRDENSHKKIVSSNATPALFRCTYSMSSRPCSPSPLVCDFGRMKASWHLRPSIQTLIMGSSHAGHARSFVSFFAQPSWWMPLLNKPRLPPLPSCPHCFEENIT